MGFHRSVESHELPPCPPAPIFFGGEKKGEKFFGNFSRSLNSKQPTVRHYNSSTCNPEPSTFVSKDPKPSFENSSLYHYTTFLLFPALPNRCICTHQTKRVILLSVNPMPKHLIHRNSFDFRQQPFPQDLSASPTPQATSPSETVPTKVEVFYQYHPASQKVMLFGL